MLQNRENLWARTRQSAQIEKSFRLQSAGSSVERVGTNGAADAFMSGATLGFMKHMGIRQMAKLGQAAAGITLEVEENVNPQLCIPAVAERAKIEL